MEEDDIPTFAARIKAKYPDYESVDDYELVERVVRKHPVYASKVRLPSDFKLLQTSTGYPKLDSLYEQAGRDHNVDPNLLLEQGRVESINFNPDVVYGRRNSPAGARGLGQFMPGTAPRFGLTVNDQQDDRTDPTKSVPAQAKYMRTLLDMFDNDEQLALAGYNAGEGAVQKHGNKIPPFKETQKYTKMIGEALNPIRTKGFTLKRQPVASTVPVSQPEIDDPYAQIGATTQSNATPEKIKTLDAQMGVAADLKNMARSGVFIPNDGTNRVLEYANKLDQKQWGVFPDSKHNGHHLINLAKAKKWKLRTAQDIQTFIDKNPDALKTLGIAVEPLGNNTRGTAVIAKDPKTGTELATGVVTNPISAVEQAQNYKDQFPNAEIEVTDTDVVTDARKQGEEIDRLAPTSMTGEADDVAPHYPVTQQKATLPISRPKQPTIAPKGQPKATQQTVTPVSGKMPATPDLTEKDYQDYFTANPDLIDTPANRNAAQELYKEGKWNTEAQRKRLGESTEPVMLDDEPAMQRVSVKDADNAIADLINVEGLSIEDATKKVRSEMSAKYDKDFSTLVLTDAKGNPITDPTQLKKQIGLTYGKLKTYGVDTEPLVSQKVAETRIEGPEPDLRVKSDFSAEDAESLNNTFGTTIGSAIASTLNAGGNTANSLAGLLKIIQDLNPAKLDSMAEAAKLEPYRAGDDVIKYLQGVGASTGALTAKTGDKYYEPATEADKGYLEGRPVEKETWATTGGKAFGALADMPRVALMPGGLAAPMLSFATDAMLQAASQGEKVDWGKVKQAGIHGAVLGGIAQAAPFIGKAGDTAISTLLNKASSNVLKEGIVLGTIGGGTYAASRAMGASPDAAFREAVLFSAMHGFGVLKKLKGEPIRVKDTNGNEAVIKVSENGKVETLDPKTEAKAQMVIPKEVETQIQAYLKKDAEIQAEAKQEVTNVVDNSVEITHKGKKVKVSPEVKSKLDEVTAEWREQDRVLKERKAEEESLGQIKQANATNAEITKTRNEYNKQKDALIADNKTPKGDVAVEPKVVDKPVENKVTAPVESKVEPTDTGEVQVTQTRNGVTRTGVVIDHPTLGERVQIIRPDGTKGGTTGLDESWKPIDPVTKAKQEALDTHITETVADTTITPEKAAESILKTYESTNTPNTRVEPAKTAEVKTDSNVRSEGKTEPKVDEVRPQGVGVTDTKQSGQGKAPTQTRLTVPKEYGASNTKFTRDKAENAKAVLLKKFGGEQTKMGSGLPDLDAETLRALKDLAGFHLEAGVKKLGELADKVAKEVGDWSRPHIESIYAGMKSKETSNSQGEVKVSRSIVQKAVDAKELPLDIAKYDKTTNKGRQAAMDDLVANHPEQLQRILDGKEKVPDTMLGAFIKAVEDHANKITDPQQARDIRRALIDKVTPETSVTAQELQGLGVREQDSLTVIANELKAARKEAQQIKGHDVKGMEKRIADLEKQLEDHKVGLAKEQTKADVAEAVTAERASRPFIDRAERYAEKLRTEADKARERLKKRGAVFTSGVDPVALKDLAQIGASHIADLGLDFAKFSDKMIGEFGDKIKPHLKDIYDKATDVAGKFERRAVKMIETRLEGQIENLERQIETKTRDVVKREPIPLSEKGKALQAKRNELRKELDALVPKEQQTRTVAQKQEAYKKNLERQIEVLNKRIETGETPVRGTTPTTPEIDALKQKRDALKAKLPAVDKSISDAQYNTQRAKALQKQITDLDAQIKSGVKTERETKARNVSPEVAKLIEKRDQLKAQYTDVFGKPEMSDAKRLQLWKKNAENRIAILKGEQEAPTRREPIELDAEGRKLQTQINLLKSKVDLTDAEIEKIAELTQAVADTRASMQGNRRSIDATSGTPQEIAYGLASKTLHDYVNDLKHNAKATTWADVKKQPFKATIRGVTKTIINAPGVMKSMKATLDNSALFRQGWKTLFTNPLIWKRNALKSFSDIARVLGGKNVESEIHADIVSRPTYDLMKKAGLDVGTREEAFPSALPEKIPGFRRVYKASETAYMGFLHKTRADIFDKMIRVAKDQEVKLSDQELTNIGRMVNSLTGRGYLGKLELAAEPINTVFFSPRMLKGQIDTVLQPFWGGASMTEIGTGKNYGSKFVRKQATYNLLKSTAGTAAILATAKAISTAMGNPNAVTLDPRSSDFGKIKIGNTRFDVTGGTGSILTLLSRIWSGQSVSTTTGKVSDLENPKFGGKTRWEVAEDFFENKLSPMMGIIRDFAKGKNFDGEKPTIVGEGLDSITPLPVSTFVKLLKDPEAQKDPGFIAFAQAMDMLGITVNTYENKKKPKNKTDMDDTIKFLTESYDWLLQNPPKETEEPKGGMPMKKK